MIFKNKNLRGKKLEAYKKSLKLNDEQREVLIGTLLGDSSISLRDNKPHYSVKFEQCTERKEYVEHLYTIFEPFVGTPPKPRFFPEKKESEQSQFEPNSFENETTVQEPRKIKSFWFRTYQHSSLIFYYNMFYKMNGNEKVKIVPKNIHKFLTPRALAYWFMDDGNITSDLQTYVLNTQSFEKHECVFLCDVLYRNFSIFSNIEKDKNKWRIRIRAASADEFKRLIIPYVHPVFDYKLKKNYF